MANTLVKRMLDVIESQYAHVVTLRTLSVVVGRQPAYLGRLFQQEVGSNVRTYLTRVRLRQAAALIRGGVKIEAVALSVGYRSKKNFYQQFKRQYGTTPLPYRGHPQTGDRECREFSGPHEVPAIADSRPTLARHAAHASASESEPVLGRLGSIVRASNKAWRLAVKTQEIMLAHFTRSCVPMLLTDDTGRYIGANPAAVSLTGYSVPELHHLSPSAASIS